MKYQIAPRISCVSKRTMHISASLELAAHCGIMGLLNRTECFVSVCQLMNDMDVFVFSCRCCAQSHYLISYCAQEWHLRGTRTGTRRCIGCCHRVFLCRQTCFSVPAQVSACFTCTYRPHRFINSSPAASPVPSARHTQTLLEKQLGMSPRW